MSTVNPLKAELVTEQKRNKDMSANVDKCTEQVKVEKQTSAIMRKQYEGKLKVKIILFIIIIIIIVIY